MEVVIRDDMEASRRFLGRLLLKQPLSLNLKPLGMHSRVRSRSLGFLGTSLLLTFAGGADQLVRVVEAALRGCATQFKS
jgi:hypothetical protein